MFISLYMLYVRGNNDTDNTEYYVNHLMFAVFRELDGDMGPILLYYRSKSRTTMAASWRDAMLTELFPKIYKITA